jgi:uncharacterized membrane protein YbhN (UPF0104 family)
MGKLPKPLRKLFFATFFTGLYVTGRAFYDLYLTFRIHHYDDRVNFKNRYGTNTWAVVTGASDGIGKAIS